MMWFENIRVERETKSIVIKAINRQVKELAENDSDTVNVESTDENGKTTTKKVPKIDVMVGLLDQKRKVKMNAVEVGDVVKAAANVAVVAVLVGFEMGNILNQKGSRFLKVL